MEKMEWQGIQLLSLVFALIGAALGISYTPELSKKQVLAALLSGLVCGMLAPEIFAYYIAMPAVIKNAMCVVFGVGGMFIVPGILTLWRGFSVDPLGFIDRLRGIKNDKNDRDEK